MWPLLYNEIWGEKKDQNLFLLRAFRDAVLLNTEIGRDYIFMLYNNSLEIVILLFQNPQITGQAGEIINEILPAVQSLLYQDKMIINKVAIDEFESLLNQLEPKASPGLKTIIKKVKEDVREEKIFNQLWIAVVE